MDSKASASGVQQLINRLREQGVQAGQSEADQLLDDARGRATHLLEQATAKAEQIKADARREADQLRVAADAALKQAMRDTSLKLREEIENRLANELRHLVSKQFRDPQVLEQLLTEIVRQAVPGSGDSKMRVLLPASVATVEELRANPEELEQGSISQFVVSLARSVLEKGIEFAPAPDDRPGLRVELVGNDMQVDLTDASVTQLLLKHLMPRYRAILEGMVA